MHFYISGVFNDAHLYQWCLQNDVHFYYSGTGGASPPFPKVQHIATAAVTCKQEELVFSTACQECSERSHLITKATFTERGSA